jgi:hypothetical protein
MRPIFSRQRALRTPGQCDVAQGPPRRPTLQGEGPVAVAVAAGVIILGIHGFSLG